MSIRTCINDRFLCSLRMYNSLVERCFKDCIDSFRSKNLDKAEEKVLIHDIFLIHIALNFLFWLRRALLRWKEC